MDEQDVGSDRGATRVETRGGDQARSAADGRDGHDVLNIETRSEAPARERPAAPDKPRDDKPQDKEKDGKQGDDDKGGGIRGFIREHKLVVIIGAVVLIIAAVVTLLWWLNARHFESTDDAFIDSRQFAVAPKVTGYLVDVQVTDNQHVEPGTIIAKIDPRDYTVSLEQAKANLAQTEAAIANVDAQIQGQRAQIEQAQAQVTQSLAALQFAQQEQLRAQDLVQRGAGTVQTEQQRRSQYEQAQSDAQRTQAALVAAQKQLGSLEAQRKSAVANRDASQAQVDQAELNVGYTTLTAAQPGRIVRLTGAKGQYVQAGQNITMFVPDNLWVTANYKETQITDMRPGQKVDIYVDAYPGRRFDGHVDSIQPGSGTAFSLLPAENATGNYVKVVQRVPVKLVFDNLPGDIVLGPGMSVVPYTRVR
ncbi:MAG: HlyD family secretion protein [Methylobacteriaceae bacterium]|nr:HlyD family secretion protein [Methylobacteriaceae bacterium]